MRILSKIICCILVELLLVNSAAFAIPLALAASSSTDASAYTLTGCTLPTFSTTPVTSATVSDPALVEDVASSSVVGFNLDFEGGEPLYNSGQINTILQSFSKTNGGTFDSATNTWTFCTNQNMDRLFSGIPTNSTEQQYLDTLQDPLPKISMSDLDRYAIEGEPCRLFITATGQCDETLVPDLDATGKQKLNDDGTPAMKPKYFDDIFTAGASKNHWDAPKADVRILKTLVYLTTPTDLGGANHESITVSRIIQTANKSTEIVDPTLASEDTSQIAAHSYDMDNPEHPVKLSQAMDISAIDTLRVTTRVTEQRRACIGGGGISFGSSCDKVTYNYSASPIKVSWQTDAGAAQSSVPTDLYHGSLSLFSAGLGSLLNDMNLNTTIDPTKISLSNLGDVSKLIGSTLLSQSLNTPGKSITGWDANSTLDSIGRSYIADQLGLPDGALSDGNTTDDITQNIGETAVENAYDLPHGSLKGATSADIWTNVGQRYLEDVLDIQPNTLTPQQYTTAGLLEKIGQGKIEKALALQPTSFSSNTWATDIAPAKNSSEFTKENAGHLDDVLGIGFQDTNGSSKNVNGFTPGDFNDATKTLLSNPTPAAVSKYKQLIGSRTIESSMGRFTPGTASGSTAKAETAAFLPEILSAFGITLYATPFGVPSGETLLFDTTKVTGARVTYGATSNETTEALISSGIYTRDQIIALTKQICDLISSETLIPFSSLPRDLQTIFQNGNKFSPANFPPTSPSQAPQTLNTVLTTWQIPIQTLLNSVTSRLNSSSTVGTNEDVPTLLSAQKALSTAVGSIKQYTDGLLTTIDIQNQSGQSAALNLPGTVYASNPDGTFNTSQKIISSDPVTTLLSGNLTTGELSLIGKLIITQKIIPDRLSQRLALSQIVQSESTTYGAFNSFGVDPGSWTTKGFDDYDFERIFTKGLAQNVFDRIGKLQLLQTTWNITNLQPLSGQGSVSNSAMDQINVKLSQAASGYAFYKNDFDLLKSAITELINGLSGSDNLKTALKAIGDTTTTLSIGGIRDAAQKYEVILNNPALKKATGATQSSLSKATPLVQELIAGHPLSFSQTAEVSQSGTNSSPQANKNADGCLVVGTFRDMISNNQDISSLIKSSAGCRVDDAFNLPVGSMTVWINSNDNSYNGFAKAIGTSLEKNNTTQISDSDLAAEGNKIVSSNSVSSLTAGIPGAGVGGGFKAQDVFNVLSGYASNTLEKMGTTMVDNYLNWDTGTAETLVNPRCTDQTTQTITSCGRTDASTKRTQVMATMGLKELGDALNFPTSLTLSSSQSFVKSFGNARISEILGLAQNSFTGSFKNIIAANAGHLDNLLNSLSWYQNPEIRNLQDIQRSLQGYVDGNGTVGDQSSVAAAQSTLTSVSSSLDSFYNTVLGTITDPGSSVYGKDTTATGTTADTITTAEAKAVSSSISQLKSLSQNSSIGDDLRNQLDGTQQSLTSSGIGSDSWNTKEKSAVLLQMSSYTNRIGSLGSQLGVSGDAFQKLITGSLDGDSISVTEADKDITNSLVSTATNKLLANTPFASLTDTFTALTKGPGCDRGVGFKDFLLGTGPDTDLSDMSNWGCSSETLGSTSLSSLLTGSDTTSTTLRTNLYDHLLSRSFGMNVEKKLNFEPGTIRAIFLNPWEAKDIAIDQGIRTIGAQMLNLNSQAKFSSAEAGIFNGFRNSIMAGFCPVNPLADLSDSQKNQSKSSIGMCSLNFNSTRALGAFEGSLNQVLDDELKNGGGTGHNIGLTDLAVAFAGGMDGIYYLGAAEIAKNLNITLGSGSGSQKFKINFTDIRNAFGGTALSSQDLSNAAQTQQSDFVRNYYVQSGYDPSTFDNGAGGIIDMGGMSNQQVLNIFNSDPNISSTQRSYLLDTQAGVGQSNASQQIKEGAQLRLQYQSYDAAAYKLDPNIPQGFSYAMLRGTSTDRAHYLGLYLANTLNFSKNLFGGSGLTNEMLVNLSQYAITCFTANSGATCNQSLVTPQSLGLLDKWFDGQAGKLLGIDLPAGTVQGIFAWGSTGFKGNTFDTSNTYQVGGGSYAPLGTVLRTWAMSKLFGWADKMLGFDPGTVLSLYQAASQLIQAQQALSVAESSAPAVNSVGSIFGNPDLGTQNVDAAQANLVAAQAAVVSTVINIAFKSQIADAEKSLGLVPGTGALGVSILVCLAMGAPVAPLTIALFVAINLFGTYNVKIDARASGSGYYPYKGHYGSNTVDPYQFPTTSVPDLGSFDVQNSTSYHAGIEAAAQAHVYSLLRDLLTMPARWQAATGQSGNSVWISQIYTARKEDADNLNDLVSQPAPWENTGGFGYGSLESRANVAYNNATGTFVANPDPGYRAGLFYCLPSGSGNGAATSSNANGNASTSPTAATSSGSATPAAATAQTSCAFTDHIHLRW